MNEKEFSEIIHKLLQIKLGEETQIRIQEVRKNNNVVLQGLIIQKADSNISPTIYLQGFYEMYENGCDIEEVADRILQVYSKGEVQGNIDMDFFKDFAQVKDRIAYRLINAEKNRELLKDIPHILFLDLAICFYYAFYNEELGDGLILIHNNHMQMWNTNHQELMRLANKNTPKLCKPIFITLDAAVHNIFTEEEEQTKAGSIYVLTNREKTHGAACILYPDMLENIADKLEGNYYVIPCSIHEVIIFRDNGCEDINYLHEMILDTNNSQLLVEDILSDYPYYYDMSEKKLKQIRAF